MFRAWANTAAVTSPTRNPVNGPGPTPTTTSVISLISNPDSVTT